jgi:hypothetical protein
LLPRLNEPYYLSFLLDSPFVRAEGFNTPPFRARYVDCSIYDAARRLSPAFFGKKNVTADPYGITAWPKGETPPKQDQKYDEGEDCQTKQDKECGYEGYRAAGLGRISLRNRNILHPA